MNDGCVFTFVFNRKIMMSHDVLVYFVRISSGRVMWKEAKSGKIVDCFTGSASMSFK